MITKNNCDLGLDPGLKKKNEKKKAIRTLSGQLVVKLNIDCGLDSNIVSMINSLILIIIL